MLGQIQGGTLAKFFSAFARFWPFYLGIIQAIFENDNIKGIKIGNTETKLSQFADDSTLYLKDKDSLREWLNLLKEFEDITGLKVNIDKSQTFWVGPKTMTDKPFRLKWTTDPIESLGIFICNDFEKMSKLNQQELLDKMDKQINFYKNIKMSLSSKIFILNTKIIEQLAYILNQI